MERPVIRRTILPGLLLVVSCSTSTEPEWARVPGLIMEGQAPFTALVAPDDVARGTRFDVTVSSFGSSSCTRDDGYDLEATRTSAVIRLFDLVATGAIACTDDLRQFPRHLTLEFPDPGPASITVVGRGFDGQPLEITKTIIVRP